MQYETTGSFEQKRGSYSRSLQYETAGKLEQERLFLPQRGFFFRREALLPMPAV
jgi:hypothetical protein